MWDLGLCHNVIAGWVNPQPPNHGGFHSHGDTLDRWMVCFIENPNLKWMRTGGYPHLWKIYTIIGILNGIYWNRFWINWCSTVMFEGLYIYVYVCIYVYKPHLAVDIPTIDNSPQLLTNSPSGPKTQPCRGNFAFDQTSRKVEVGMENIFAWWFYYGMMFLQMG